jgi:short-subunit dehydrogenase
MSGPPSPAADTALVTGASAGIGRALATEFARRGHDLVLVARRAERLRSMAEAFEADYGADAAVVPMDLSDRAAPDRLFETLDDRGIELDVLVNNVGVGAHGRFGGGDLDEQRTQLRLNVEVLVELTHRFLDGRERGKVLNVGSLAGFTPGPLMAGYYASKAYVNSFSEALAAEHADDEIDVTVVCPGPVDTEFQKRAGMGRSTVGAVFSHTPAAVASAAYEGLYDGKVVVIPGIPMTLLYLLLLCTPRGLRRRATLFVNGGR